MTAMYIGGKSLLITNYNWHMCFSLLRNSVTLDDLERLNSLNRRLISPNCLIFGTYYAKLIKDTPTLSSPQI